jgi:hypothetical protein
MATVKKYNLAGLNANVELGKRGSYILGSSESIGFYAAGGELQKVSIANAVTSSQAITKAQLDEVSKSLVQHITVDIDYTSGNGQLAIVAPGSRIISVTVDIPEAWTGVLDNTTTFVEIGDTDNGSRFIRSQDVDVLKVGQYHSQYQFEYLEEGTLTYSVTQGSATGGSATISVVLASDHITVTDYGLIVQSQNSNPDLGNITL